MSSLSVFLFWCASFEILSGFMKWGGRRKMAEKRLTLAIFKLLGLSYMHTTLYFLFFYSNNMNKFCVV